MNPELAYFLKINAGLALFFAFYRMFLHKDTFFGWRRTILLCFLSVSLLYPLLNFQSWIQTQQPMVAMADLYATVMLPDLEMVTARQTVSWTALAGPALSFAYWMGVMVLLLRFLVQLACIVRIRLQSRTVYLQGTRIFVPKKATEPFSFFHWIFLQPDLYTAEELDEILTHELTHAHQAHSLDVVFSELMCVACWMNPFAWLLKQEIRNNLEYMADHRVLETGHDHKAYQFHLLGLAHQKHTATLSNSFNVLPLKKRIRMMNKKRTREIGKAKYLIFLPLAALLLAFSNIETVARTTSRLAHEAGLVPASDADQNPKKKEKSEKKEKAQDVATDKSTEKGTEKTDESLEISFTPTPAEQPNDVFEIVENMPVFPGGFNALLEFIQTNLRYPVEAQKAGIQGRVIAQFIVEKDGTPSSFSIVRSVSPELNAEAIRMLSTMPKWKPGTQRGEAVRVNYTIPIVFRLSGDAPVQDPIAIKVIEAADGQDPVFQVVDQMPEYPGGMQELMKFIAENTRYPESAHKKGIQGRVIVQFTITKEGEVINPVVVRSIDPELDAEAIRVASCMPKWIPGKQKGTPVDVMFTVPMVFTLQ